MLSLPCIKPHDLVAFEEALTKTLSPKEQKQHMKSLLLLASGNKLKALAAQKSVNIITNVSSKHSHSDFFIAFCFFFTCKSVLGDCCCSYVVEFSLHLINALVLDLKFLKV